MAKTKKRLTRSSSNKRIAGVCGGFADYVDQDPTLIRLIFIAILLLTGVFPGIVFYLVAWLVMDEN